MADIRINALATTAASTASDDFVAVDGSANGTRKLNAYSPTFGGAVTGASDGVFGASTNKVIINRWSDATPYGAITFNANTTAAGSLGIGGGASGDSNLYLNAPTGGTIQSRINGTSALTLTSTAATFAGNLTASGTGTHTFAGQITSSVNAASTANLGSFVAANSTLNSFTSYSSAASLDQKYWTWQAGAAVGDGTFRLRALNDAQTNGINAITVTRSGISSTAVTIGGNLTVSGTGTSSFGGDVRLPWGNPSLLSYYDATYSLGLAFDSTNRKLVLRAQSADAPANGKGTISFETGATPSEIARFAPSTGNLLLKSDGIDSSNGKLQLAAHSTSAGGIGLGTTAVIYNNGSSGIIFGTNASTTALTLDSSQNATFAGTVSVAKGAPQVKVSLDRNSSTDSSYVRYTTNGTQNWVVGTGVTGSDTNYAIYSYGGGGTALSLSYTDGNATFAGTVITPAATTAISSVRLPHGTAPTSPVNGDMWTTTAGLYVRINGVTVGPLS